MRKKLYVFLVLLLASNIAYSKNGNNTKTENITNKKHKRINHKTIDRFKRSSSNQAFHLPNDNDITSYNKFKLIDSMIKSEKIEDHLPFWATRGRRDSSSKEALHELHLKPKERHCYHCNSVCLEGNELPFWGQRGRRDPSSQSDENSLDTWDDRVRRQDEEDDPFWGSRGRRNEDPPFWGSRGRREHSIGVKQYFSPSKSSEIYSDDDEPFWGNRGRRKMNKAKNRMQNDWSNTERVKGHMIQIADDEKEPFWGNRGKRKIGLDLIPSEDNDDKEIISKMKRKELSFWANRGRQSRLRNFFTGAVRSRMKQVPTRNNLNKEVSKPSQQRTIHDDRIYAEEPHYILIERSSRSSFEEDPYIITRGKKYSNIHLPKPVRGRRGAIEDIVRSVQNDPYYIARGKKDSFIKIGNTIMSVDSLNKDKETVCALVNSLISKSDGNKIKREIDDAERDRRTILKKLAAQLQADPYFVSRGKKDPTSDIDQVKDFVEQIIEMC